MDKNTKEALMKVGQSIPKELMNKLIIEKKDDEGGAREKLIWEAKKGDKEARALLATGAFNPTVDRQFNKKVEKEIDSFVDGRVKDLIKQGKIPPAERDEFMAKMQKKTE